MQGVASPVLTTLVNYQWPSDLPSDRWCDAAEPSSFWQPQFAKAQLTHHLGLADPQPPYLVLVFKDTHCIRNNHMDSLQEWQRN